MSYPGKYSQSASSRSVNRALYKTGKRTIATEQALAPIMYRIAKDVVSEVTNSELKHFGHSEPWDTVTVGNNSYILNDINAGTGASNRIGRQMKIKSVDCRVQIKRGSTGGARLCRLMLIKANHDTGGVFNPDDVTSGVLGGSETAIVDFYDTDETKNYTVLYNKFFQLGDEGAAAELHYISIHKEFKNGFIVQYSGTGASESDISHGALFLVLAVDMTGAGSPQISFQSRVRYIDN